MRQTLLNCCKLDWGQISPAIFGSLFQSVMNPQERRNLGAHYTSEKNILKVIKPLFLDALWREFEALKANTKSLQQFHKKLASLRFLDPACGCGNFLIITYRELRLLEMEVIKTLQKNQTFLSVNDLVLVDIDQFYGIEYEKFPAQIAQVAMWLMDHQMNLRISEEFGQYYVRLPLRKSATIRHANALRTDWQSLLPNTDIRYDYIVGNPPFLGKAMQNEAQKEDMAAVFKGVDGAGVLDYVSAWYMRAAQYINNLNNVGEVNVGEVQNLADVKTTKVAFVSTNSITQGEQVGILWNELFKKYHIKIHFAHRSFKWGNEAKGSAGVHVVIIGFSNHDTLEKFIFEYETYQSEPHEIKAKNINPYLVESNDIIVQKRTTPISNVPSMIYGSKPVDDGNFMFTTEEKNEFLKKEPNASKFFREITGAEEYINNKERWCLWLKDAKPDELKNLPLVFERIQKVRNFRQKSTKAPTRESANFPALFSELRQPVSDYIIFPLVSSENRKYIPIGFLKKETIVTNLASVVPKGSLYLFGILTSQMHMTWAKYVCGRLESRFRYSNTIVYNNFPFPLSPSEKQVQAVEAAAQAVLDARAAFSESSLADLYDPLTMPSVLVKAHQVLDKAVDACYRSQPFASETKRIEYLFELYEGYVVPLVAEKQGRRK